MTSNAENTPDPMADPPQKRRRRGRAGAWLVLTMGVVFLAVAAGALMLSGRGVSAPGWATSRIEARINRVLEQGSIRFGGLDLQIDRQGEPLVRMQNVTLSNAFGAPVARFERVETAIKLWPLFWGQIQPRAVRISGGTLRLRRDADGTFDLAFGPEGEFSSGASVAKVLADIADIFSSDALSSLDIVDASQVNVRFEDGMSGQVFSVAGGRLTLFNSDLGLQLSAAFGLESGGQTAEALLTFFTDKGDAGARMSADFQNLRPTDIALQLPQMAWLTGLQAPLSGSVRLRIEASGELSEMTGTLGLGAGRFQFDQTTPPVTIQSGKAEFSYTPVGQRLTFKTLELSTSAGKIKANGHGFLSRGSLQDPRAIVGQVTVPTASIAPEGVLAGGLNLTDGALDFKLELNPFSVRIGQFTATTGTDRIRARGKLDRSDNVWRAALDVSAKTLSRNGFLAFWPIALKKNTRIWLDRNITKANLRNVELALRWRENTPANFATNFEFRDATVTYLKTLPPIENAVGRGSILRNVMSIELDKGTVNLDQGASIDVAGSVMRVPDLAVKDPPARFDLKTDSTVHAALILLDKEPFRFLTKAGMGTDILTGRARLNIGLMLPLAVKIGLKEVDFDVTGQVFDARSDVLVPGRVLSAPVLRVAAKKTGMRVSGKGLIDRTGFDGTWSQAFGPTRRGQSKFKGTIRLDDRMARDFRLGFPKGTFRGAARAVLALDIRRDAPLAFRLTSDLDQIGFSLPQLGWSKPRAQTGSLVVEGHLGKAPIVDKIALKAAGLSAEGRILLKPGGGLNKAEFSRVALDGWLNAGVTLTGRGIGTSPAVSVHGGVIDIRKTSFGQGRGGGGNAGPIDLALDRLVVSNGITLNGFTGNLTTRGGISGTFEGRVNDGPTVAGTLAPAKTGTAIRIRSAQAGKVLRAAGVFKNAKGGKMDLILSPRKERGAYTGRLTVKKTRLVSASAMAELLNAISVIGLLDQLNGPGIQFNDVEADFVLTPDRVVVTRSSAVGPSIGISLDGTYYTASEKMEMQGVVSPIYLLNGIGQIFTRRGEGLFGFNFRLVGTAKDPKVRVNPLSILTPGMFREIFRRPAPKVPSQ